MNEIKKSSKGIDYAPPKILKSGQRVYSQALLMRIPHEHSTETDISLKIGRYKHPITGMPSGINPKSELTLTNEELDALVQYISENYTPVSLGTGEYINVAGNSAELN